MKNRKLLILVRCTTRKFYLHRPPKGRKDWHVGFAAPAIDGARRIIFRSTGTKEVAAVKRIAAQIIESQELKRYSWRPAMVQADIGEAISYFAIH
jgi:hypothetical protein